MKEKVCTTLIMKSERCKYLLFSEFALDFITVTHTEHDGLGELPLDTCEPCTQIAHVLIQLLHHHQSLLQLPHPDTAIKSFSYSVRLCVLAGIHTCIRKR